jgi:Ca-activated chloride channel family protein
LVFQAFHGPSFPQLFCTSGQDEVFIVTFSDRAHLEQSFTNDMNKLEQALVRIKTGGGTSMRDAVNMSLDYVKSRGTKDKKVLVTITDGNDNSSKLNVNELVRKSQQGDVLIYSIGMLGQEVPSEARIAIRGAPSKIYISSR